MLSNLLPRAVEEARDSLAETSVTYIHTYQFTFQDNLLTKRDKLQDQLNEAKLLQENIQKRSGVVSSFLQKYFSPSEYEDFERFLERKSKLIMDSRELSDKIALSEEQMRVLTKNV